VDMSFSAAELRDLAAACSQRRPLPELHDEAVRRRARELADAQGLLETIERELAWDQPIPTLPFSRYRDFRRTGNRTRYQDLRRQRDRQIDLAALACWFGPDRMAYLQDLLWADCETWSWVWPAHERPEMTIDLFAAIHACRLAMLLHLFEGRMDSEVAGRVRGEVFRRVLDDYIDPAVGQHWKQGHSNWNAVCTGATGLAALLLEDDADRLARALEQVLAMPRRFLGGFAADGGCSEGPGYWQFGFGWYLRLAAGLHEASGGRVDLMDDPKIDRIVRYPLAVALAPGQPATFADCSPRVYLQPDVVALANRFRDVPELFSLCERGPDGRALATTLWDLLLYDGRVLPRYEDNADSTLQALGVTKLCAGPTRLAAKAGHNGEMHNHNDVGSFILHRGGACFLTDPGGPVYSRATFSEHRYESVYCNSFGHSVPVVNGQLQGAGKEFAGTLAVGPVEDGAKVARIDMTRAYPAEAHLQRLTRRLALAADGTALEMQDDFAFEAVPQSLEEAFITGSPAEVIEDGAAVRVDGGDDGTCELRAVHSPGRFAVTELAVESRAEDRQGRLLRRITFQPAELARKMTLRFEARLA